MAGQNFPQGSLDAAEMQQLFQHAIIIHTIPSGYNSGRTYYLKANSELESSRILENLSAYSVAAKKKAESKSKFAHLQRRVRRVYRSKIFEVLSVSCIVMVSFSILHALRDVLRLTLSAQSFLMSVLQMQTIRNYTGQPNVLEDFSWDMINFGFTVVFACELAMNALGHWFRPFVRSYWNLIDVIVVLLSLASLSQSYLNVNVVRMLRAVRVVRLFGKVEALKRVVAALSASVVPMSNAFIIMFIMISICTRLKIISLPLFIPKNPIPHPGGLPPR
jgi:hypothetical protein